MIIRLQNFRVMKTVGGISKIYIIRVNNEILIRTQH